MKNKITLLIMTLIMGITNVNSQLSTIPSAVCESFKPSGWIFFNVGSISVGELFTTYDYCFFTEPNNTMDVVRVWDDNVLNYNHHRYQQNYMGIEVEGCEFIEHSLKNRDFLVYANGKICSKIHTRYTTKTISEEVAFENLLAHFPEHEFAWDNSLWELGLQSETGDPLATYFPTGELVFALTNYTNIQYDMNPLDYTMAWRFDVVSVNPDVHYIIYVDALTGNVIEKYNTRHFDGYADISGHGSQLLDTKARGWPNNDFVLESNNGDHNIHTKIDGGWPWAWTAEVDDDDDDDWGSTQQLATAPHWMVTQAWDYFTTIHGRDGMNNFNTVRVRADENGVSGALYDRVAGFDIIKVGYFEGGVYSADLAIMGHEFSHGVDQHEGKLKYQTESGALDESYADIFGFLTRRWVTGSTNWIIGAVGTNLRDQRNMKFPKTRGFHLYWNITMDLILTDDGQPDTYGGEFFFDLAVGNDAGGVHVNSGVMNHWFYMLSQGEVDVNDLGDAYTVYGIGIDKAAIITYYNFVNNMEKLSQYEDAMEGANETAKLIYGNCSFEHIETQNAWFAAGVGDWSSCAGASIDENELDFAIYPNPTTDNLIISFDNIQERTIEIYTVNGQLLKTFKNVDSKQFVIDVSKFANGTYIINVLGDKAERTKFVKQ